MCNTSNVGVRSRQRNNRIVRCIREVGAELLRFKKARSDSEGDSVGRSQFHGEIFLSDSGGSGDNSVVGFSYVFRNHGNNGKTGRFHFIAGVPQQQGAVVGFSFRGARGYLNAAGPPVEVGMEWQVFAGHSNAEIARLPSIEFVDL